MKTRSLRCFAPVLAAAAVLLAGLPASADHGRHRRYHQHRHQHGPRVGFYAAPPPFAVVVAPRFAAGFFPPPPPRAYYGPGYSYGAGYEHGYHDRGEWRHHHGHDCDD